jgi:hypothetical protein
MIGKFQKQKKIKITAHFISSCLFHITAQIELNENRAKIVKSFDIQFKSMEWASI